MKVKALLRPQQEGITKLHVDEVDIAVNEPEQELSKNGMDFCYFVISGYGTLKVDEYKYALSPQSSVYIPAGNDHWVSNTGNVDMKLVRYYTNE